MENINGIDAGRMEALYQNPYAYYLPIHADELKYNKELEQNPFYK